MSFPSEASCPGFSNWAGVTVRGDVARIVTTEGKLGETLVETGAQIEGFSVHSLSGRFAYSEMVLGAENFCPHQLHVQDADEKCSRVMFTAPEMIHSLSWSPDGSQLAFFVGDAANGTVWLPQQLFALRFAADTKPVVMSFGKTTIYGPKEFSRNLMEPQIVWSADGKSICFIDGDKNIVWLAIESGKKSTIGSAERVFGTINGMFVIARKSPWRLMRMSSDGQNESVITTLDRAESVGIGTMVPDSTVLSVVVRERQPRQYMKNPWMPTLFVDLESGSMCGRIGEPIVGYFRSASAISR
jgi:Tol biopolymer transport system component